MAKQDQSNSEAQAQLARQEASAEQQKADQATQQAEEYRQEREAKFYRSSATSPVVSRDRRDLAMEIGDHGRFAKAKNILSQHARFLLEKNEAEKIVSDMRDEVAHWSTFCGPAGFRRTTLKRFAALSCTLGFPIEVMEGRRQK